MLRQVKTENGWVRGIPAADPRITAFKGIPYAAPPVGELRWRAPQPAANWEGVRECYQFGPISMQETPGLDPNSFYSKEWHVDPEIPMSEDSLNLNIWTPAKSADEKLPVWIWIYGGAFMSGYSAEMEFDGERCARRGIVMVTINYRVNVFAWFAHPELTAAAAKTGDYYGNFGFLDQKAAFEWVQRNIAAFGGDPNNVTIGGQSAGGGSVLAHLVSPVTGGLFHKAIVMSAGGIRDYGTKPNATLADAEKTGVEFVEWLGLSSVDELRKLDAKTLYEKSVEFARIPRPGAPTGMPGFRWTHFTDGKFLTEDWTEAQLAGRRWKVPVLAGHTTNDFRRPPRITSLEAFEADARNLYGDRADEYLELVDFKSGDIKTIQEKATFPLQELGSAIWNRYNAKIGFEPIYGYTFDADMVGDDAGAFHSSDLWFVFETLAKCWRPFKAKHYDLARLMCNYWTNFVKTGDPNGLDADGTPMPKWKPYTLDCPYEMYLGDEVKMLNDQPALMKFLVDFSVERYLSERK